MLTITFIVCWSFILQWETLKQVALAFSTAFGILNDILAFWQDGMF
jgi:hypothetical protein